MAFREWSRLITAGERAGRASLPDPDPPARAAAETLLDAYHEQVLERHRARQEQLRSGVLFPITYDIAPDELPAGKRILELSPEEQVAIVRAAVDRCFPVKNDLRLLIGAFEFRNIGQLVNRILRRKLPYSPEDVGWLLARVALPGCDWNALEMSPIGIHGLLRSIERWSQDYPLPDAAGNSLARLQEGIASEHHNAAGRKFLDLLDQMLGTGEADAVDSADDWGHFVSEAIATMLSENSRSWMDFITFTATIPGTRPSQKWLQEAADHVNRMGESDFAKLVVNWLALLDRPTRGMHYRRADGFEYPSAWIADRNAEVIKGLAWTVTVVDDDALTVALGDAALACYKKIPNYGARSTKAGNACVHALSAIATVPAIAQLQRILQRVKLPSQRNQVELALASAAESQGLSLEDLAELVVPGFDLQDGTLNRVFGDYTAVLVIQDSDTVELHWLRPDGKPQKSVPAVVKRDFPDQVKYLKRIQKEIREALATQRTRIERLIMQDREWDHAAWRERYLDHPLVSHIARRLIWTFEHDGRPIAAAWLDGHLVDVNDKPIGNPDEGDRVRLWHPIDSEADTVLAWREWLERHEVTQPFKQAHREIYVLTDAERETKTYSNRFAAHVIRQHQFSALCQQRGWSYRLQGAWDGFNVPSIDLPAAGLRAEYWIEPVNNDDAVSHSYIYLYATTDQVRFVDIESNLPVPLTDVLPRVFSEVMRDVDLFVAVSSIGADPNWLDGGPGRIAGYQDYWWDVSFGELSATAETRREVLARLLPRLAKLEGRWELDGRFLTVRGSLRGYKIHLGSGNVLMEPNDQYLCIVPGRGARGGRRGDGLFLPFEGDRTLSIIISKALMLAGDAGISDPTITRQISPADA